MSASNKSTALLVSMLLVIHGALLAYSATKHSPTQNEPAHLVAGLSHWKFGRFELYRVNPPSVRMIAALPVMAVGYEEDWSGFFENPGARPVYDMGADFIRANGERSIWLFIIARWACIPFSLIGGLFCFFWSRELWGRNSAGLLSLTLWCFEPNILAHGELITPDCAATSFGLGAGYLFWRWLKQPDWARAASAGFLFGLAQLSKMTWVILFGLWPLLWIIWIVFDKRRASKTEAQPVSPSLKIVFLQLVVMLLLGLNLLNLGYLFDGTCSKLGDFTFVSKAMTGLDTSGAQGNRFRNSLLLTNVPVPVPKQYLIGMDIQQQDFENFGQRSYLGGEWKDGGWWYYYLYAFAVKTPHGTQLLLLFACFSIFYFTQKRPRNAQYVSTCAATETLPHQWVNVFVLIAPAIVVFTTVSCHLEFNHHFRYVLPTFGFLFVFTGVNSLWFSRACTENASSVKKCTQND